MPAPLKRRQTVLQTVDDLKTPMLPRSCGVMATGEGMIHSTIITTFELQAGLLQNSAKPPLPLADAIIK